MFTDPFFLFGTSDYKIIYYSDKFFDIRNLSDTDKMLNIL
ncbi:hypothetical protein BACCOP_00256 [Phocaeicola coprocola DSM 17136]|uniref:Uncharacterized protein n=1 Tax=Phocaeicola coprocola DSM 17136 TaxID=470145 RepID=B3JEG5_9BACT|nr:hypothetical protein BACCOP_00256 [Phocaeicola coprocola DSM 17136]